MRGLENSTRSYDVTYKLLVGIFHSLLHTYKGNLHVHKWCIKPVQIKCFHNNAIMLSYNNISVAPYLLYTCYVDG